MQKSRKLESSKTRKKISYGRRQHDQRKINVIIMNSKGYTYKWH